MTPRAEVMGKVPSARMLPCYVVRTVRAHAAIGAMAAVWAWARPPSRVLPSTWSLRKLL